MVKIHRLSKRAGEDLIKELKQVWPPSIDLGDPKRISIAQIGEQVDLLFSEHFKAVRLQNVLIPFLGDEKLLESFPETVVDSGAVRFLCNGADVMRPGITAFKGSFKKGDIVVVQEEKHHKYIAVGLALLDSTEASKVEKGAVVKSLHYVGDKVWEAHKQMGL